MGAHKHKAKTERMVAWMHCVAGGACSGASHGNVVYVATCSCGAERQRETNGAHNASSGWYMPAAAVR